MNRCVNIDWLEVYCLEFIDVPRNADYFKSYGYKVRIRDYGTPQYKEMFTLYDDDGFPQFEVRRNPYSLKKNGGIFFENACHIRLSNRACYKASPIDDLRKFLIAHKYNYQSIARIDICLDFNTFDSGEHPEQFIRKYTTEKISKLNQSAFYQFGKDVSNIYMHGKDNWNKRTINSLKWGSDTSSITTKMYNKSLELNQKGDKFYIRDAWKDAGLKEEEVWRIEFSLNSSFKILDLKKNEKQNKSAYSLMHFEKNLHNLCNFDTREKCLFFFHVLAAKYFQFRERELLPNGEVKRKDRCKLHTTFKLSSTEKAYEPKKVTLQKEPTRTDKMLIKRLYEIIDNKDLNAYLRNSALDVATYIGNLTRLRVEESLNKFIMTYDKDPRPKIFKDEEPKEVRKDLFGIIPDFAPF